MGYGIKEIEDLIINAIDAPPINGYCNTVESYAGQFDSSDQKKWARVIDSFPVLYVMFAGSRTIASAGAGNFVREMTFTVITADESVAGVSDAAGGVTGAYKMNDDILSALNMNDLGKADVLGLIYSKTFLLAAGRTIAAYGNNFKLYFPA